MYKSILVPVDNSEHSNASVELALAIGKAFGSSLAGSHVYAAKLHDMRFKQMEFTLPDEYKEEEELEKQRKIHDALIARGLHLISDSYLDQMDSVCSEFGLTFERKHFDGRNFEAIVDDVRDTGYDLVVLGALGMGAVKNSQLGSVCERVLRRTTADTLVVRDAESAGDGPILVCLDGSARSLGAFEAALQLADAFGKGVQAVTVAENADVALLDAHLEAARRKAEAAGVEFEGKRLEGATRRTLIEHADATRPWLIAAGRSGLDAAESNLGSTADALVRDGRWNVLLAGREAAAAEATAAA